MVTTHKPFASIDDQIARLNHRGVSTDEMTAQLLKREGYYSIVNGYKEPFIDEDASAKAGEDRYILGTKFSDMYGLFSFDRDLRELTFHHLLRIEALVRTVCAYTFAEFHDDPADYLKPESFASESEYLDLGLSDYHDNMHELHSKLRNAIRYPKNEAVQHYKTVHGGVPIWVLMNTLTFGNIEHFFNLMKRHEQNLVCKRIVDVVCDPEPENRSYLAPITARRALDILVKYRNICAHDERLYCACVGDRRSVNYVGFVAYASDFLDANEYRELIKGIVSTVSEYSSGSLPVKHVLDKMGFSVLQEDV